LAPAFGDAGLKAADIENHDRVTDSRPAAKFGLRAVEEEHADDMKNLLATFDPRKPAA